MWVLYNSGEQSSALVKSMIWEVTLSENGINDRHPPEPIFPESKYKTSHGRKKYFSSEKSLEWV